MKTVDLTKFGDDEFVLHFEGTGHEISAVTFANTLISFVNVIEYFGRELNHNQKIAVIIGAAEPRSFCVHMRLADGTVSSYIFDVPVEKILGAITGCLFRKAISSNDIIEITERDGKVVIGRKAGKDTHDEDSLRDGYYDEEVVISHDAYSLVEKLEDDPNANTMIANVMKAVDKDSLVKTFRISHSADESQPALSFSRPDFSTVIENCNLKKKDQRSTTDYEDEVLIVYKAIFERSDKKWQFIWNDEKISVTIKDKAFFDRLENRTISISHGDIFRAHIRVHQVQDASNRNRPILNYEVIKFGQQIGKEDEQILMNFDKS